MGDGRDRRRHRAGSLSGWISFCSTVEHDLVAELVRQLCPRLFGERWWKPGGRTQPVPVYMQTVILYVYIDYHLPEKACQRRHIVT